jgi:hypothetical protein
MTPSATSTSVGQKESPWTNTDFVPPTTCAEREAYLTECTRFYIATVSGDNDQPILRNRTVLSPQSADEETASMCLTREDIVYCSHAPCCVCRRVTDRHVVLFPMSHTMYAFVCDMCLPALDAST